MNRVGTYGGERKYLINIERTQIPRYRLEEFVKKIVVKRKDAEHVLLEFYCSKYADKFNLIMTQGFISEITKIKDEKKPTEIFTFDKVWFVTSHAYGSSDYLKYEYDNLHYIGITEFDGDYVIAFEANVVSDGFDLTSKFYDDIMAKKYENQEAKQKTTLDLTPQKEYTCKQCGKSINPYDARIIEQTYGEMICLDCLEKKAEELQNLKYSVKKP